MISLFKEFAKYAVPPLLLIATAYAFYLVWMNRDSEKIVTATVPIATAALIGIFMSVFIFGGIPPITVKFPVSFIYHAKNKSTIYVPHRINPTSVNFQIEQLFKEQPQMKHIDDEDGSLLYHHLLHRAIIDYFSLRYRSTWESEISRFNLPFAREERFGPAPDSAEPSLLLPQEQIEKLLTGNYFAKSHFMSPLQIALPPKTKIRISAPVREQSGWQQGELYFENDFCNLRIQTQRSSGGRGLGSYKFIVGLSEEEDSQYWTQTFLVAIKAEFNKIKSGHPKMTKNKNWVNQVIENLRAGFDEERIWADTKADYLFYRQTQVLGPARPFGRQERK